MKILKNIEDKNKRQLKAIKDQGKQQINAIKNINISSKIPKIIFCFSRLSPEAEKLITKLKKSKTLSTLMNFSLLELIKKKIDFRVFKDPYTFASIIYHEGLLDDAKDSQNEMLAKLEEFKSYTIQACLI